MDSDKNTIINNTNNQNKAFSETGTPNNGSGNRNNYNRKKKQRHFGPSQTAKPATPSGTAPSLNPASSPTPGTPPNSSNAVRPNTGFQHGAPGGNNPPRPKLPNPQNQQNYPNPQQRSQQNTPYQASQQARPANRPPNSIQQGAGNRNAPSHAPVSHTAVPHVPAAPHAPVAQPAIQNQAPRNDRPNRKWENRMVKIEETFDDIRKDNERIEKEIWLEIAEIHNAKLD